MSRSLYKEKFFNREVLIKSFQLWKKKIIKHNITFYKKNSLVPAIFCNKTLMIYTGIRLKSYRFTKDALGFVLGEFALTRKQVKHTGKRKKISKKRPRMHKSFFIYDFKSKFFTP